MNIIQIKEILPSFINCPVIGQDGNGKMPLWHVKKFLVAVFCDENLKSIVGFIHKGPVMWNIECPCCYSYQILSKQVSCNSSKWIFKTSLHPCDVTPLTLMTEYIRSKWIIQCYMVPSWSQNSWNTVLRIISGMFFTPKVGNLKLHIFQLTGAHCVPQWTISPCGGVAQHNSL